MTLKELISGAADYFPMLLRKPAPKYVSESGNRVYGMVAEFHETPKVYHAAEMVRDAGYSNWDVHTPFPIHDIETAMGMKTTKLPLMAGAAAITGVSIFGMLALNGLPRFHHPLFSHERFYKVSDNRFMICIEAHDPKFDPSATRALLERAGGTDIALIEDED